MTLTGKVNPAYLASTLLHLGVLAALVLVRPVVGDPAGEGPPVAVRLADSGDLAAALAAAGAPQTAAEPAPDPPAPEERAPEVRPPEPAAPAPAPPPPLRKPVPAPTPKPVPAPARQEVAAPRPAQAAPKPPATRPPNPRPAAAAPAQPRPPGGLDLDALASQVARLGGARPGAPASGGAASGPSAAALAGLQDQLQRRWTPNCEVEGGRDVRVRVSFRLGPGGDLDGPVEAGGLEQSGNAVVRAAAERAIRAVHQAAPFPALSGAAGQRIAVNFNAREACS